LTKNTIILLTNSLLPYILILMILNYLKQTSRVYINISISYLKFFHIDISSNYDK